MGRHPSAGQRFGWLAVDPKLWGLDLEEIAPQGHAALDIVLGSLNPAKAQPRFDAFNVFRGKDKGVGTFRLLELINKFIHEKMISGRRTEIHQQITGFHMVSGANAQAALAGFLKTGPNGLGPVV